MSDDVSVNNQKPEPVDKGKWFMFGLSVGVVIAAITLEMNGYIKHSKKTDSAVVEEFKLLSLDPKFERKISPKSSGKEAFCADGYLLIKPKNDRPVAGILVDSKNRGVTCSAHLSPDFK